MPIPVMSDEERVLRAAARLSRREQRVLQLSAGEGLSVGDLAARLGLTSRQAERLLARAIANFDRALERLDRKANAERR